jgi:hypothetical protein
MKPKGEETDPNKITKQNKENSWTFKQQGGMSVHQPEHTLPEYFFRHLGIPLGPLLEEHTRADYRTSKVALSKVRCP